MMGDLIITINHARAAGYCVPGLRHWAKIHHFDFRDFIANGIPATKLLETGDHIAIEIVNKAQEQSHG